MAACLLAAAAIMFLVKAPKPTSATANHPVAA